MASGLNYEKLSISRRKISQISQTFALLHALKLILVKKRRGSIWMNYGMISEIETISVVQINCFIHSIKMMFCWARLNKSTKRILFTSVTPISAIKTRKLWRVSKNFVQETSFGT